MGRTLETTTHSHLRRRAIVGLYMLGNGQFITQRILTRDLRKWGFRADSNSTNADLRWFRRHGIELATFSNPAQHEIDKLIIYWKENRA